MSKAKAAAQAATAVVTEPTPAATEQLNQEEGVELSSAEQPNPDASEQVAEPTPAAEQTEEEVAIKPQEAKNPLLRVTSSAKATLRQPSSGWLIKPGETREMLNDGWLNNQLNARLLALA